MLRKLLAIGLAALLAGCGLTDRVVATATGHAFECVNGVQYIVFSRGASVAYTPAGKIATCGSPS